MGFLSNWLEKRRLNDKYNSTKRTFITGEGRYKPPFGCRFWMKYNIHAEVVDREKFCAEHLLEDEGISNFIVIVNEILTVSFRFYYVRFDGSLFPLFYEVMNYKEYLDGEEELKLHWLSTHEVMQRLKENLNCEDLVKRFGVNISLFIDKEFRLAEEAGAKLPEVIKGDVKDIMEIGKYIFDKSTSDSFTISVNQLEGIKDRFLNQSIRRSRREDEKLQYAIEHLDKLVALERKRGELENIETRKNIDKAKLAVEYKGLEAEYREHEVRIAKSLQALEEIKTPKPVEVINPIAKIVEEYSQYPAGVNEINKRFDDLAKDITKGRPRSKLSKTEKQALENLEDARKAAIKRLSL